MPRVTTPAQAVDAVQRLVDAGSDYIKFMVDDGSVEGRPGLPTLDQATLDAGVAEAQRLGMLTIAHALSVSDTRKAVRARGPGPRAPLHGRAAHRRAGRPDRRLGCLRAWIRTG